MVGSVVPIVIGYAIAHYATLLVVEGQRTAINWSDPLGRGWNVFGSAEMGVNSAIFNYPTAIAVIQLTAIVGGHVLGIIAAHELAVRHLPPARALVGQLPMLAGDDRLHLRRAGAAVFPLICASMMCHDGLTVASWSLKRRRVRPPSRTGQLARDNLLAEPSRWGTLSWISAKALIDSINHGLDRFSDGLVPQLRAALGAAGAGAAAADHRAAGRHHVHDHRGHRGAGCLAVRGLPVAERRGARSTNPVS